MSCEINRSEHTIIMQIGDNDEEVDGITQENSDIDALSKRWNNDIFILLNPMYGSW
jgi:predicted secreted acid phosphatase